MTCQKKPELTYFYHYKLEFEGAFLATMWCSIRQQGNFYKSSAMSITRLDGLAVAQRGKWRIKSVFDWKAASSMPENHFHVSFRLGLCGTALNGAHISYKMATLKALKRSDQFWLVNFCLFSDNAWRIFFLLRHERSWSHFLFSTNFQKLSQASILTPLQTADFIAWWNMPKLVESTPYVHA